jgi:hypothetical protein
MGGLPGGKATLLISPYFWKSSNTSLRTWLDSIPPITTIAPVVDLKTPHSIPSGRARPRELSTNDNFFIVSTAVGTDEKCTRKEVGFGQVAILSIVTSGVFILVSLSK